MEGKLKNIKRNRPFFSGKNSKNVLDSSATFAPISSANARLKPGQNVMSGRRRESLSFRVEVAVEVLRPKNLDRLSWTC